MSIVEISGEDNNRPYLEGGEYGTGLANDADVNLVGFEFPAEGRPCPFVKEKAWIAENPANRHAYFSFTVVTPNGEKHFLDRWVRNSGGRLKKALLECGATVTDLPNNGFQFDASDVAPRKIGGLVLGTAREYQGEMRTGFINKVISAG